MAKIILAAAAFSVILPGMAIAEFSFQQAQNVSAGGIMDNLPPQLKDAINGIKDISADINNRIGKYIGTSPLQSPINVNFNQLENINLTQRIQSIFQSGSSNDVYQLAVKIIQLVGNLILWILNIVIDLIKQALALLR